MSIHPVLDVSRHFVGVKIVEILQDRGREREDNFKYRYSNYKTLNISVNEQQAANDGLWANCDTAFSQGLLWQRENNFGVLNCIITPFLTSTQTSLQSVFLNC